MSPPSRADRLAARFEAAADPAPKPARRRRTPDPATAPVPASWDATHRRVTYWMHTDVIAEVREAAASKGESVASFVDRALRTELKRHQPKK